MGVVVGNNIITMRNLQYIIIVMHCSVTVDLSRIRRHSSL